MYLIIGVLMIVVFFWYLDIKSIRRWDKLTSICLIIFLSIISGIRYDVGRDYISYQNAFYIGEFNGVRECLYWGINYIVKLCGGEFYVVTFIIAIITNVFIYIGLKRRNKNSYFITIALLIFACTSWVTTFNLMRQGVSVAIFFFCSTYIKEKNFKRYLFWIIIGSGFHSSMILLLPLYFIDKIRINVISYISILICAYIIVYTGGARILLSKILEYITMYSYYSQSAHIFNTNRSSGFGVLVNVIISLIVIILTNKSLDRECPLEKQYYLYSIILSILGIDTYMYGRLGIYFMPFIIVVLPIAIKNIIDKNMRIIVTILMCASLFVLYANQIINPSPESKIKYKTIISNYTNY